MSGLGIPPWATWRVAQQDLCLWQRHSRLSLVFSSTVSIARLANLVRLKEQHLRYALVCVDFCWQRGGIRKLESDMALPLRF